MSDKFPATLQIGPYRYAVVCSEEAINKAQVEDKTDLHGRHHPGRQEIALNPEQAPDCMADTLLHEILHACVYLSGVDVKGKDEERMIGGISSVLLDCLRRNPKLVTFLVG